MTTTRKRKQSEIIQGYVVCDTGAVFSVRHGWRGRHIHRMTQNLNCYGYWHVRLTINGKRKTRTVHKLVAMAFLPPRPSKKHQIRHIDGNKNNNHVSNLAWGTAQDNADDRANHGKTSSGIRHSEAIKKGIRQSKSAFYRHNSIPEEVSP